MERWKGAFCEKNALSRDVPPHKPLPPFRSNLSSVSTYGSIAAIDIDQRVDPQLP